MNVPNLESRSLMKSRPSVTDSSACLRLMLLSLASTIAPSLRPMRYDGGSSPGNGRSSESGASPESPGFMSWRRAKGIVSADVRALDPDLRHVNHRLAASR